MSREFRIEREVVLPATPEQVFAAVTEGAAGWVFPDLGVKESDPEVKVWDPPHHLFSRVEGDGWFNALEHIIEAREGGTTVVRYVHSGIFVDGWEGEYDGASKHTDFYMHSLGQYLRYFFGRPIAYLSVEGPEGSTFDVLRRAVGVESATEGDTVSLDILELGG